MKSFPRTCPLCLSSPVIPAADALKCCVSSSFLARVWVLQGSCIPWTLPSLFCSADNSEYDKLWEVNTTKPVPRTARRKFNIDSFVFHKVLGKGSFGKVCDKLRVQVSAWLDLCNVMGSFLQPERSHSFLGQWSSSRIVCRHPGQRHWKFISWILCEPQSDYRAQQFVSV